MAINLGPGMSGGMSDAQAAMINYASNRGRGGLAGPAEADLAARRGQLDQAYSNLQALLNPRAAGQDSPFTDSVLQSLLGQASDAAAGQLRGANMLIDRQFAGSGLANSGQAMSARLSAQRRNQQDAIAQQNAIRNQAAIENFAAKERSTQMLQNLVSALTAYQGQMSVTQPDSSSDMLLAQLLGGSGGGGAVGGMRLGGGGGAAGAAAPVDNWYTQWQKDQQATEDAAAAIRARNAALIPGLGSTPGVNRPGGIGYGTVLAPPSGGFPAAPAVNEPGGLFGGYGFMQQGPAKSDSMAGPWAGGYIPPATNLGPPAFGGLLGLAAGTAKGGGLTPSQPKPMNVPFRY